MYCSSECMDLDLQKFHQYDCDDENNALNQDCNTVSNKLCQLLYDFDWDINSLRKWIEKNRKCKTVFDFDLSDKPSAHLRKSYWMATLKAENPMLAAHSPQPKKFLQDQMNFIGRHPELNKLFSTRCDKKLLNEILVLIMTIPSLFAAFSSNLDMTVTESSTYEVSIFEKDYEYRFRCENIKTVVLYSFNDPCSNLLKMSCFPSVWALTIEGKICWIVTRPISTGEEITSSVENFFIPKQQRQERLMQWFNFSCSCRACLEDWPSLGDSKLVAEDQLRLDSSLLELSKMDSISSFKALLPLMDQLAVSMPNLEYYLYLRHFEIMLNALRLPTLFDTNLNFTG